MGKIITYAIAALITLMSMLFAFMQQRAAHRAQVQAEVNLELAEEARREARDFEIKLKNCKDGK